MQSSSSSTCDDQTKNLPLKEIPGTYGQPFIGPLKDRWDYFYYQGEDEFFRSRIQKYTSTVFRTNMPPGPFISTDPRVIAVLDSVSFPILFDTSKVEKQDVLDGTFMPSLAYTGGYRPLAYLDPSEPNHNTLKAFFMSTIASLHHQLIPTFQQTLSDFFVSIENELSDNSKADFNTLNDNMSFDYTFRWLCNQRSPTETVLGSNGVSAMNNWLIPQIAPLMTLGIKYLPNFIEDLFLHTFPLPFLLVQSDYTNLYNAFYTSATLILDEAEKKGIKRDEACHNLVFLAGFNFFGGMKSLFPRLINWVGSAGKILHSRLVNEIRTVVKSEGGVTLTALDKMALVKSVVYEALRIDPPVPYQYAKAKQDIVINSHDAAYAIKKGEMIFGYQPLATKDPKVFVNPEEFIADRFVGNGSELLKYLYWSNGRETMNPTPDNKQCPAKNVVLVLARLMLVQLFLRYDTFSVDSKRITFGTWDVTVTSVTKAT